MSALFVWIWENLIVLWPLFLAIVNIAVAIVVSAHTLVNKRDSRSTIAWVGLIWLTPLIGAFLYFLLGVNRIQRRGQRVRAATRSSGLRDRDPSTQEPGPIPKHPNMPGLRRLVGNLTDAPACSGNTVEPLIDGDEAFPAMLEAIEGAQRSIALSTYIFDYDRVGEDFLHALSRAVQRGVAVRVIIDSVGARYSRPRMPDKLENAGVPVARFLPTRIPRMLNYANLRNHRKILVIDGKTGFTGGINIREGHRLGLDPAHPVRDIHFRIRGPVVAHLQAAFCVDWEFCKKEVLDGEDWFPVIEPAGPVVARGIPDGPDEDFDNLELTILGAIASAQQQISIMTPYFLPEEPIIDALNVAAMRGVKVRIVLPVKPNVLLVQWACTAMLWQLLERGCRIWYGPPPFDHTKLVVVDHMWSLVGSTNWDPRSLRLNFEFNLECYDDELAGTLEGIVSERIANGKRITLEQVDARSLPIRVRDGAARLLSPYM